MTGYWPLMSFNPDGSITREVCHSTWSPPLATGGRVQCRIVASSFFLFGLDSLSQPASLQSSLSRCLRSVVFPAESRHRGTERARGAESEPSPADIWEETASAHSEECCPHYKAHSSGHSSPVGQWHTCFLWPILLGVLTAG